MRCNGVNNKADDVCSIYNTRIVECIEKDEEQGVGMKEDSVNKKQMFGIKGEIKKFLIIVFILFLFLCAFIYWFVQNIVTANANEYLEVSELRLRNEFSYMYDKLENYAVTMSGDKQLKQLLTEIIPDKTRDINYVKGMMTQFKILEPTIVDIALVSDNMYYSTIYHDEELDEICTQIVDNTYQWIGIRTSSFVSLNPKQPMFLYGKNIVAEGKKIGTILISVKSSFFYDDGNNMPFCYALADERDTFFYMLGSTQNQQDIRKQWQSIKESSDLKRTGRYYIKSDYIEKMNCFLISVNPLDKKYTNLNMRLLQVMIWTCIFLVVIFMMWFLGFINNKIVKPLQIFYDTIKEIRDKKQRHMEQEIELTGCIEIQEIGREFSGMMMDIEELNKKIFENTTHLYELELKKQDAELSYLRGQVDPHFLYNTLEVLRKQALMRQAPELAQMAIDMGKIFRYSSKGETIVTLEEELSIVKSYVRIQENRFQGRLQVLYMVPDSLLHIKVMKMLMQPIIENAIYHGIEPKTGKGALFIGVRKEEGCLIITIKDNGVGIPEIKLKEICGNLSAESFDTSRHVGILNTQARIKLMYGTDFGLKIESSQSDGTSVYIRIPVKEEENV